MLKHAPKLHFGIGFNQPPLGGCVLKPLKVWGLEMFDIQPPLGGCVLKHNDDLRCPL